MKKSIKVYSLSLSLSYVISRTKNYRYLGMILDEKLSWADHIHEICSKLSQVAGAIFKTRRLLSKEAMKLLYHGLVGSKLRYGLICWATAHCARIAEIWK